MNKKEQYLYFCDFEVCIFKKRLYISVKGKTIMPVRNNSFAIQTANRLNLEVQHFAKGTWPVAGREYHTLPVNRFFIVINNPGQEACRVEDAAESFVLKPGNAYFAPLHHPCKFLLDRELEFISIHFTLELYEGVDIFSGYGHLCEIADASLLRRAQEAFECPSEFASALQLRSLITEFTARLVNMPFTELEHVTRFAPYKKELDYLQKVPPARVTVEELAALHGVSRENFSRSFTRQTGITPKNFLTRMILSRICRQLTAEKKNIREIAFAAGFNNEFYFSKFFRKHMGCSPKEYRQRTRLK